MTYKLMGLLRLLFPNHINLIEEQALENGYQEGYASARRRFERKRGPKGQFVSRFQGAENA